MTRADFERLHRHLFQDDGEEHAAFLLAGVARTRFGRRLLIREVEPVPDTDFTRIGSGYRISSRAAARAARRARSEGFALVWAHSHPGEGDRVKLGRQDSTTIREAHPTLVEIADGPVAALVFAETAVAGEVWEAGEAPAPLQHLRILGQRITDLEDGQRHPARPVDERHARQALLLSRSGQSRLGSLRVAVVGAGGGGSMLVEQLGRLGVGEIWVADFDRITRSNLSRIVGSRPIDALLRRRKVAVARRNVRRFDPKVRVRSMVADAAQSAVARELAAVDAIFVATDTALGRYAANAIAYQYAVPVFQVGAKVESDDDGRIQTIHIAERIAMPGHACLHCQRAIPPDALHREQLGDVALRAQNYLGGAEDIPDPSVISLNAIPVGLAVTDFMLMFCGLLDGDCDLCTRVWYPLQRRASRRPATTTAGCRWCDPTAPLSAYARGDAWPLPLPSVPASAGRSPRDKLRDMVGRLQVFVRRRPGHGTRRS